MLKTISAILSAAAIAAFITFILPGAPVDVAIILLSAELVLDAVKDCAAAGVRHLVVLSSGFSETGAEGNAREARIRGSRPATLRRWSCSRWTRQRRRHHLPTTRP